MCEQAGRKISALIERKCLNDNILILVSLLVLGEQERMDVCINTLKHTHSFCLTSTHWKSAEKTTETTIEIRMVLFGNCIVFYGNCNSLNWECKWDCWWDIIWPTRTNRTPLNPVGRPKTQCANEFCTGFHSKQHMVRNGIEMETIKNVY